MDKHYKLGIIGAGKIVENHHLPVLKNMQNVSVEWIYDVNIKRTELLSLMYDVPSITGNNWEKAIQNIDVCLLTVPYGVRKPYIDAVARFNKSIYIEKPFALTVNEHVETSSLFKPHQIAIGFQRRFYKLANDLKQIIDSSIFGALKKIDFVNGYFTLKGGAGYVSDAKLAGGGIILESGIHTFDLILNISGATDVQVRNVRYIQREGIDYESTIDSTLTTKIGSVQVSCRTSTLRNLTNGLTLSFENAILKCQVSADAPISAQTLNSNSQSFFLESKFDNYEYAKTTSMSFFIFWKNFIEALEQGSENITSASKSLLTTKWMQEIYARIRE